mmetsp:Transcript_63318/g.175117  ORF Transcript_63318/g.175117 Transcript_63318/m.175117 type:complete len:128 (-) Transcript_63318:634-1017(-)
MNRVGIGRSPIRRLDETIQVECICISQLPIDKTYTATDNGATQGPGDRSSNVRKKNFRCIGCHATTTVAIDDRPKIESDQRMIFIFQSRKLCLGVEVRRECLQQDIHEGGTSILGGSVGSVRRHPRH